MKKLTSAFLIALFFAAAGTLFAGVKVTIVAPKVSGTGNDGLINAALENQAKAFETQLKETDLKKLGSQDELAGAFANASTYAANSAAFTGYQGYDLFAFMGGMSIGLQASSLSADAFTAIGDDISEDQDTNFGASISQSFNLGVNISMVKEMIGINDILPNRLYANIKYWSSKADQEDLSFESTTFGLGLNYQLIDNGGDRWSFFKWTGVSVGTGFLYNSNTITMNYVLAEYESEAIAVGTDSVKMVIEPDTKFGIESSSFTIPVDASTSVRLLWAFNLTLGAGLDFNFGQGEIVATSDGPVKALVNDSDKTDSANDGSYTIDGSTTANPTIANLRITTGLGICFGPVPLDFSLTYFPITSGAAFNISSGIVW